VFDWDVIDPIICGLAALWIVSDLAPVNWAI